MLGGGLLIIWGKCGKPSHLVTHAFMKAMPSSSKLGMQTLCAFKLCMYFVHYTYECKKPSNCYNHVV